jgi:PleD family two-component response regulator
MNGIECLRRLKNIDRLNKAKVFMYSTTSDKPTVMLANELGAEEFIVKPAKLAQLQEKLCQIFYN